MALAGWSAQLAFVSLSTLSMSNIRTEGTGTEVNLEAGGSEAYFRPSGRRLYSPDDLQQSVVMCQTIDECQLTDDERQKRVRREKDGLVEKGWER